MDQLKNNLAVATAYQPLTDDERLELIKETLPLVTPDNVPWKTDDWQNPVAWKKR